MSVPACWPLEPAAKARKQKKGAARLRVFTFSGELLDGLTYPVREALTATHERVR
jgi:hypothetical protein